MNTIEQHQGCAWKQVGLCVYCTDHGERLYQGRLPAEKDPRRAENETQCSTLGHDWDEEFGLGFYFLCRRCGVQEWPE